MINFSDSVWEKLNPNWIWNRTGINLLFIWCLNNKKIHRLQRRIQWNPAFSRNSIRRHLDCPFIYLIVLAAVFLNVLVTLPVKSPFRSTRKTVLLSAVLLSRPCYIFLTNLSSLFHLIVLYIFLTNLSSLFHLIVLNIFLTNLSSLFYLIVLYIFLTYQLSLLPPSLPTYRPCYIILTCLSSLLPPFWPTYRPCYIFLTYLSS